MYPVIETDRLILRSPHTGDETPLNEAINRSLFALQRYAILSTIGLDGHPHEGVVAIREIQSDGIIFFTQKSTRKVEEISTCSNVTLTFLFERFARQVIIVCRMRSANYGLRDLVSF